MKMSVTCCTEWHIQNPYIHICGHLLLLYSWLWLKVAKFRTVKNKALVNALSYMYFRRFSLLRQRLMAKSLQRYFFSRLSMGKRNKKRPSSNLLVGQEYYVITLAQICSSHRWSSRYIAADDSFRDAIWSCCRFSVRYLTSEIAWAEMGMQLYVVEWLPTREWQKKSERSDGTLFFSDLLLNEYPCRMVWNILTLVAGCNTCWKMEAL